MRKSLAALATVAALCFVTAPATATTVRTAPAVLHGLADTTTVEQVRTVCRTDPATNRRVCWIDRSQPPTVCHWVRDQAGNLVRDCY